MKKELLQEIIEASLTDEAKKIVLKAMDDYAKEQVNGNPTLPDVEPVGLLNCLRSP